MSRQNHDGSLLLISYTAVLNTAGALPTDRCYAGALTQPRRGRRPLSVKLRVLLTLFTRTQLAMSATLVRDLTTDSTRRAILNSPRLYLACELGWTQWTLGFATGLDAEPGRQTIAAFDLCARPSAGDITMAVSTQGDSALRIRTVTLILLCTLAGSAFGQTPTGLTLFGDSLTDTGNISELTFGLAPGSDYFDGRFSNGPVWAEVMAQQFGLASPTHSRGGGSNYAYGGAETGSGGDRIYFY